jgi:amidase
MLADLRLEQQGDLGPRESPGGTRDVEGPRARPGGGVAREVEAQIGEHPFDPRSMPKDGTSFLDAVDAPVAPKRVAFSRDLGGVTKVASEVGDICAAAARRFEDLGAAVEEAAPDLGDARATYRILRAHSFVITYGPVVAAHRDKVKRDVIWNVEEGERLTSGTIAQAERRRGEISRRMAEFFATYDLLLCPACCTPAFDVEMPALMELEGHKFESYYDWYAICYVISLTTCPAMSVPCGFTREGLPVGMQMIGPVRGESRLLSAARLLEQSVDIVRRLPIDPRKPPSSNR